MRCTGPVWSCARRSRSRGGCPVRSGRRCSSSVRISSAPARSRSAAPTRGCRACRAVERANGGSWPRAPATTPRASRSRPGCSGISRDHLDAGREPPSPRWRRPAATAPRCTRFVGRTHRRGARVTLGAFADAETGAVLDPPLRPRRRRRGAGDRAGTELLEQCPGRAHRRGAATGGGGLARGHRDRRAKTLRPARARRGPPRPRGPPRGRPRWTAGAAPWRYSPDGHDGRRHRRRAPRGRAVHRWCTALVDDVVPGRPRSRCRRALLMLLERSQARGRAGRRRRRGGGAGRDPGAFEPPVVGRPLRRQHRPVAADAP